MMKKDVRATGSLGLLGAVVLALVACGPSKVQIDPRSVVNVDVRPASGQRVFCPGDPFQAELVVKLKDGTQCSSTDRSLGCMGKRDAVIDPKIVRIEATGATSQGDADDYTFRPNENPLATAANGMTLKGWLETSVGGASASSEVGETNLSPVYACMQRSLFQQPVPVPLVTYGVNGSAGPSLHIAVTTLSTPFYADAALVRIESSDGTVRYVISQSSDAPVLIVSRGQAGFPGVPGQGGRSGADGAASSQQCGKGGRGEDGTNGLGGGLGGTGGPGGSIDVVFDADASDKLRARVRVESGGGEAGPGGIGGTRGFGGKGGAGGPSGQGCTGSRGDKGADGQDGPTGPDGNAGPPGPSPTFGTGTRKELFARELKVIEAIEATKRK